MRRLGAPSLKGWESPLLMPRGPARPSRSGNKHLKNAYCQTGKQGGRLTPAGRMGKAKAFPIRPFI
ncbi:MAG: hypothetical protein DBY09_06725 [Selenomonadales bacterium]|nr:MAG: hypothetical protein DBY09_06725 [Selenomonadales bacterium]